MDHQSCERALESLKYFCENTPEYYVIAAGLNDMCAPLVASSPTE